MAHKNNQRNYGKLFPGVEINADTLKALKQGDNKENYFMVVLKRDRYLKDRNGNYVRDENGQTIKLPEREVSLDKLLYEAWDFPSPEASPEQKVIAEMERDELHRCIRYLPVDEKEVIYALFFSNYGDGMSEREFSAVSGIPQKTINDRKLRAFAKLRKMLRG